MYFAQYALGMMPILVGMLNACQFCPSDELNPVDQLYQAIEKSDCSRVSQILQTLTYVNKQDQDDTLELCQEKIDCCGSNLSLARSPADILSIGAGGALYYCVQPTSELVSCASLVLMPADWQIVAKYVTYVGLYAMSSYLTSLGATCNFAYWKFYSATRIKKEVKKKFKQLNKADAIASATDLQKQ